MPEHTVGIRQLKSHLSNYMRRVKSGATLVITERGKRVGQLVPVASPLETRLERLVATKMIAWDGRQLSPSVPRVNLRGSKTVAELLLEDRE